VSLSMHTTSALAAVKIERGRAVIFDGNGKFAYPTQDGDAVAGIVTGEIASGEVGDAYILGEAPNAMVGEAVAIGDLLRAVKTTGKLEVAAASVLMDSDNAKSDITFTVTHKYQGAQGDHITVTFTDAGAGKALAITVSGFDIDVQLQTGGGGAIESTAAEIVAAIAADADAADLVVGVPDDDGSGVVKAIAKSYLTGGIGAFARAMEVATADGDYVNIDIFGGGA